MPLEREHRESQLVSISLAQLTIANGLEQQGQMSKCRHGVLPAEGFVEKDMKRCTGQPLLASDDMADQHEMIIHDIGQMISGQIVGTLI